MQGASADDEIECLVEEGQVGGIALLQKHIGTPPSLSRSAPTRKRSGVRSMPTTWRTWGAISSATWAAPQATSRTTMSGASGSTQRVAPAERLAKGESGPENNPTCRANDWRTSSSEGFSSMFHWYTFAVTVTADLANNLPEPATPMARRHAGRDRSDCRHLRLRRARPGHGLAFPRPAPTRICVPGDH